MLNSKRIKTRNTRLKIMFLCVMVIISLLFSKQDLMYPFYLNFSQTNFYIPLLLFAFIYLIVNKKIYLDLISLILFLRIVVYLIPLAYVENVGGYWGNYLSVVISFFAYLVSSQKHNENIFIPINKIFVYFLSLVSLQVIYMYFYLNIKYGELSINFFKLFMVIPIGASNYIASVILPLVVFIYYSKINKKIKYIAITLGLVALIIIQSKNAIFILLLFIALMFLKLYMKNIRKIRNSLGLLTNMIITIIILLMIFLLIFFATRYIVIKWNMGLGHNDTSVYEFINAITSGRLDVYQKEIKRWIDHILFGNGLSYNIGYTKSHNWIIELLVQSGLIGFVLFTAALIIWYKKIVNLLKRSYFVRATFYSCFVILLQGFAEVSLFTITIDFIFWFFIGLSISEVNRIKGRNKRKQLVIYGH